MPHPHKKSVYDIGLLFARTSQTYTIPLIEASTVVIVIYNIEEVSSFVPSAITQPFFELQPPDFAWKFVWTVPTNYEKKFVIT